MRRFGMVTALVLLISQSDRAVFASDADDDRFCRPYFGSACSDAMGRWLPYFGPPARTKFSARRTTMIDAIVDPAGAGPEVFLDLHGPMGGSLAVFGSAGPPKAHVVYDPVHRIAYYDVGCCSWHRVVVAANAPVPPRVVAMRSLTGLHTELGIRLGDRPEDVMARFGRAKLQRFTVPETEAILTYTRTLRYRDYSPCERTSSFVFREDRLVAIAFDIGC